MFKKSILTADLRLFPGGPQLETSNYREYALR